MIINFHSIDHDFYGVVEQPTVVLKTPHGAIIAPIAAYNIRATFRYNDVSEIEFDVSAYTDGVKTAGYDEIAGFRQVSVGDFGDFIIANPEKTNEGGVKEVKHCTAYSLEYAFNFKQAELGEGTYNFYDPLDNTDTIMGMLIEAVPDWSIGEVDEALVGRWRTFDQVNDKWYSWLMGEVQESYNCLFQFDTKNKTVNALSAEHAAENLPIYLSYQNLLSSVNVRELSDEVVTALSGYGSGDDVDIRYVNPNGTDKIYNIDFFIARGDLPDDLAAKWIAYRDTIAVEQKQYANAKTIYLDKFNQMMLAEAKVTALQTEYDSKDETLKTQQIFAQSVTDDVSRAAIEDLIAAKQQELNVTSENLARAQAELDSLTTAVEELEEAINAIIDQLKLSAYFTPEELEILSQYFIEDSITEDTFVLSEYGSVLSDDLNEVLTADNQVTVSVTDATLHATNKYSQVEDSTIDLDADLQAEIIAQLENEQNKRCIEMRSGAFYMSYRKPQDDNTYELVEIDGDIINVDLQYNLQNLTTYEDEDSPDMTKRGYYIMTAELQDVLAGGDFYPSMHLTMSGMLGTDLPTVTDTSLDMTANTATYMATGSVTEAQKQHVLTELYEYTEDQLRKLSEPSYEFNIDTANFLFAREFAPFKDALELGKTINLVIDKEEETLLKPILIEVQLDYSNLPSLELVFSNKFRASSNEFMLADIISDTARSSRSVDLNKASYSAYVDSKADSQVRKMKESAVDVTKNKIVNASNQNVEWNQSGLFLRKLNSRGEYEANQIGLINDSIAFTHDGWDSVDIAIGSFYDPNLADGTDPTSGLRYGIAAPAIYGTLIAGENLVIENTVLAQDGTTVLKQFKVDSSGVWINNSTLAFACDNGGKILIDPEIGFAAGNSNLYTLDGTTVTPSFIDENGNIIYDSASTITKPDGTYYYAPKNTKFFFNIKTGDAYFAGDINAQNIIAGTLSGTVINDATVEAAKIAISDLAELRADVAGIHMMLNSGTGALYSGNKNSIGSTVNGFYMDSAGQVNMGSSNAYIKSYLSGSTWKMDIVADQINLIGTGNIATEISDAKSEASAASDAADNAKYTALSYITTVTSGGIFVHTTGASSPTASNAYGVHISSSVKIISGGSTRASFNANGVSLYDSGGWDVASFDAQGLFLSIPDLAYDLPASTYRYGKFQHWWYTTTHYGILCNDDTNEFRITGRSGITLDVEHANGPIEVIGQMKFSTNWTTAGNLRVINSGGEEVSLATVTWVNQQSSSANTKNTAGATNLTGTKLYIVGAQEQTDHPQTYTNNQAWISTAGNLYSGGSRVVTSSGGTSGRLAKWDANYNLTDGPANWVTTITTSRGLHSAISSSSGAVSFNVPGGTQHINKTDSAGAGNAIDFNSLSSGKGRGATMQYADSQSDIRLKESIITLSDIDTDIINVYNALIPIGYHYKRGVKDEAGFGKRYGFIAQHVEDILIDAGMSTDMPLVYESESIPGTPIYEYAGETYKSIDYDSFHALHVLYARHLEKRITELENTVAELKNSGYANVTQ